MLCQRCKKNPATINTIDVINGEKFESHLCALCYAELAGDLSAKAHNSILTDLFGVGAAEEEKTCPVCGTRYREYEQTGLLGCASCYDVFKEELMPAIRRIQGKDTHVGTANINNDEYGLLRKLKTLQERLETALKARRYSEANMLNRQIKEINKILYGGGGEDE